MARTSRPKKAKPATRAGQRDTRGRATPPPPPPSPPQTFPPRTDEPLTPGFRLRGAVEQHPTPSVLEGARFVTVRRKAALAPAAIRADLPRETVEVAPDDLVEVEFAEGERLWMRGDEYRLRFGAAATRGGGAAATGGSGAAATGGGEDGVLDVPTDLAVLPGGMATRGPVAWVIKGLKVFGVDLSGMAAEAIASRVDAMRSDAEPQKRPGPGLYRCPLGPGPFALSPADLPAGPGDAPWLVLIHGTGSSTWGSFGELWSTERKAQLQELKVAYGDRVLAFEHASLTKSPIENARDLAQALPAGARAHLVTHSRGGLVGELLCRGSVTGAAAGGRATPAAFDDEQLALFKGRAGGREAQLLRELGDTLRDKRLKIERFVRAACPALGTTLASGRLDRWLSVIGSLAGAALPGSPLADAFADLAGFVAAVVKERTSPERLPGLEAMMPDSPVIKLVNWPEVKVAGDLAVIAGDIEPSAWWARLLVWLSDRFYAGDHDLVVNTPSMYGGAQRTGWSLASLHKGPAVNHFTYFRESASARRVVDALTASAAAPLGFEPLRRPTVDIARTVATRGTEARPVVIVVPGIMGSELEVAGDRVWMRMLALVRGELARLTLDAAGVVATGLLARHYGDLIERLSRTHKVVPFAYDWRLSPATEADRLARRVREELIEAKRLRQPVRLLGHSMGGLVIRTMIARHDALWREVCEHPGARFLMLGTPNGGSHAITELLVGQSPTFRKLARLDVHHRGEELLAIIGRFPGILAMLPSDAQENYFSPSTWQAYQASGGGWGVPVAAALEQAAELRRTLDASPIDPARMLYVAGSADATIAEMRLVRDAGHGREQIQFLATTRGDGRVTWDSGIPPALSARTWYMDVEHGDLAAHEPAFDALEELLEQGTTALLPQAPPVARGAGALFPRPPAEDDRHPDEDDLAATVLGAGSRKRRRVARPQQRLSVKVVHGNLAFATWPVVVGHYAGDTITSAEQHLDLALGRALSRRLQLRLYPGAIETSAVFINPRLAADASASPLGAIVVGLGTVGQLTAATLARSVARALLEYVLEWSKSQPVAGDGDRRVLGVSALLIGTGAGGIPVSDSVFALLRGVLRANEILVAAGQSARIAHVELIEVWEDRAIQALQALNGFVQEPSLRGAFVLERDLAAGDGGLRRLVYEEPAGWWHRLQILGKPGPGETDGALRFAAVTQRARNEVRLLTTQRSLVDQFVRDAVATTRNDRGVSRTLFELLLPNELKENAPDADALVLLVDEEAARYPWELLEDAERDGARPWVVDHGLLRQLELPEFREVVHAVLDDTALVVGDPVSSFTELPGAQAEAEAVWRTLQRRFTATKSIRESSRHVVAQLFARPYKVLHLAGHGVYDWAPGGPASETAGTASRQASRFTGMVLGDGVFLTPGEVQQMRQVPELVFINCCFLGRIESAPAPAGQTWEFHRLAANVSTQFIRIGVRAVIAAGWAVDDDAATTFASTFYDEMLRGRPLGKAVRVARETTFDRHPRSNTFGAYQCYGDPDYRLVAPDDTGDPALDDISIVSPAQAAQELANIAARLKTDSTSGRELERRRIAAVEAIAEQRGWNRTGTVRAALARAFAEADELERATQLYRDALAAEDGAATVKDAEQLVNLMVRHAVTRRRRGEPASECVADVKLAIAMHDALIERFGRTRERLAILASAYKRLALMAPDERAGALRKMTDAYKQAFEHPPGSEPTEESFDPYPLLNWLIGEVVQDWQARGSRQTADRVARFAEYLTRSRQALGGRIAKRRTFWLDILLVDVDLLESLAAGQLDAPRLDELADKYQQRRAYGSPREFASVLDQLDFLIAMTTPRQRSVAQALTTLRDRLVPAR